MNSFHHQRSLHKRRLRRWWVESLFNKRPKWKGHYIIPKSLWVWVVNYLLSSPTRIQFLEPYEE